MSKPAHKNTENPPGQIRYPRFLRDVIQGIEDEDRRSFQEAMEGVQATTPSTDPEKRLEGLKQALVDLMKEDSRTDGGIWAWKTRIRKILEENT